MGSECLHTQTEADGPHPSTSPYCSALQSLLNVGEIEAETQETFVKDQLNKVLLLWSAMNFAFSLVVGEGGGCLRFWTGLSILVTTALRLALLGFCLHAPNAIFVTLNSAKYRQSECETLTVVTHEGSNGGLWHRISQNKSETRPGVQQCQAQGQVFCP